MSNAPGATDSNAALDSVAGAADADERPAAELTVGGALRCHADQLPADRCALCGVGTEGGDHAAIVPLCRHHRQRPAVPLALGGVLTVSTTIFTALHGTENLMQTVCGYLLALACFAIARQRRALRARFTPRTLPDGRIELDDVAPDVSRAVLRLGADPYRKALPRARAHRTAVDTDASDAAE